MDGYKIIDFKGISVLADGTTVKIPGVFDAMHTANKPMVITNLVIHGDKDIHLKPFFTNIVIGDAENGYTTVFSSLQKNLVLTVEPDNDVSIVPVE